MPSLPSQTRSCAHRGCGIGRLFRQSRQGRRHAGQGARSRERCTFACLRRGRCIGPPAGPSRPRPFGPFPSPGLSSLPLRRPAFFSSLVGTRSLDRGGWLVLFRSRHRCGRQAAAGRKRGSSEEKRALLQQRQYRLACTPPPALRILLRHRPLPQTGRMPPSASGHRCTRGDLETDRTHRIGRNPTRGAGWRAHTRPVCGKGCYFEGEPRNIVNRALPLKGLIGADTGVILNRRKR